MLTETAIRKAKAPIKPTKLTDECGLYLLRAPSGGKWWRFKYRYAGKEKLLSLGTYPDVSLAKAREDREEARRCERNAASDLRGALVAVVRRTDDQVGEAVPVDVARRCNRL